MKWLVARRVYRIRAAPFVAALLPVFDEQLERYWKAAVWTATVLGALGEPSAEPALLKALRQRRSWSLAGEAALALSRLKHLSPAGRTSLGEIAGAHCRAWFARWRLSALRDASDGALAANEDAWARRKTSDAETRLHLPDPPTHGNASCGRRDQETAWHVAGTDLSRKDATPEELQPGQRLRPEQEMAVRVLDSCLGEVHGRIVPWSPDGE